MASAPKTHSEGSPKQQPMRRAQYTHAGCRPCRTGPKTITMKTCRFWKTSTMVRAERSKLYGVPASRCGGLRDCFIGDRCQRTPRQPFMVFDCNGCPQSLLYLMRKPRWRLMARAGSLLRGTLQDGVLCKTGYNLSDKVQRFSVFFRFR